MNFNKCSDCSHEFIFKRSVCPSCKSDRISRIDVTEGTVLEVVHLIATPDPFPDEYNIVLFRSSGGGAGFCRTTENVNSGDRISISMDENGPVCHA